MSWLVWLLLVLAAAAAGWYIGRQGTSRRDQAVLEEARREAAQLIARSEEDARRTTENAQLEAEQHWAGEQPSL